MLLSKFTDFNSDVARPDGYNSLEKMISWSRMGWRHVLFFAFIALSIGAVAGAQEAVNSVHNAVLQVRLAVDIFGDEKWVDLWAQGYSALVCVVPIVATGFAVHRFGRLPTILVGLLLLCGSLCGSFLIEGSMIADDSDAAKAENITKAVWYAVSYGISSWWLIQSLLAIVYVFCYEVTPIKFRVPAVLGVFLMETLGSLAVGLARQYISNSVTVNDEEMLAKYGETNFEEGKQYDLYFAQIEALFKPISIVCWSLVVAALIMGLAVIRRDTPAHLVNRGETGLVYDRLVVDGTENSQERVPMTKEEFAVNAGRETDDALGFCAIVKRAVGPFAVIAQLLLSIAIMDRSVLTAYYYLVEETLSANGSSVVHDPIPGMLLRHGLSMVGVICAIGVWAWCKDIRFAPAAALVVSAIGSVICASVQVFENDQLMNAKQVSSSMSIVVGVSVVYLALPLLQALVRVLIMDMFTNKSRAVGVLALRAVEVAWIGIVNIASAELRAYSWFFVTVAVLVAVIGAVALGAFYCTKWFDHSLICRDPELDACWLISEKTAEGQIIGSRDRLRPSLNGRSA